VRQQAFDTSQYGAPDGIHIAHECEMSYSGSMPGFQGKRMSTVTKKELIDRIADTTNSKRVLVKKIIQQFLDEIVDELGNGNRLEFRDFGVFESKVRAARRAQNPKTMEKVMVPSKRTVKFKVGRLMKEKLAEKSGEVDHTTGLPIERPTEPRRAAEG
jgi:integration host factor subunit beta